jgi:hypothetical protein
LYGSVPLVIISRGALTSQATEDRMTARAILALEWSLAAGFTVALMIALVRWAKRGGRGTAMLGSALVLLLGIGLVPEQIPQQRIEEAREEKGKKGAESGDPPTGGRPEGP